MRLLFILLCSSVSPASPWCLSCMSGSFFLLCRPHSPPYLHPSPPTNDGMIQPVITHCVSASSLYLSTNTHLCTHTHTHTHTHRQTDTHTHTQSWIRNL